MVVVVLEGGLVAHLEEGPIGELAADHNADGFFAKRADLKRFWRPLFFGRVLVGFL